MHTKGNKYFNLFQLRPSLFFWLLVLSRTNVQLAQEILEFNEQTVAVRVIGNTSNIGALSFNEKPPQKRAQVVVDYLQNRGLEHKFLAEGKGFNVPLTGIPPEDSRQQRT